MQIPIENLENYFNTNCNTLEYKKGEDKVDKKKDTIIFRPTKSQYDRIKAIYKEGDGNFKTISELMRRITEIGLSKLDGG